MDTARGSLNSANAEQILPDLPHEFSWDQDRVRVQLVCFIALVGFLLRQSHTFWESLSIANRVEESPSPAGNLVIFQEGHCVPLRRPGHYSSLPHFFISTSPGSFETEEAMNVTKCLGAPELKLRNFLERAR